MATSLAMMVAGGPPAAAQALARPGADVEVTYDLTRVIADVPRSVVAGHFLAPRDVTSLPDGTVLVLGAAYGAGDPTAGTATGPAVHLVAPDGTPVALLPMQASFRSVARIDAGWDGTFHVLGRGRDSGDWVVVHFNVAGTAMDTIPIRAGRPVDLAVAIDGAVYVSILDGPGRIEKYAPGGPLVATIVPGRMGAAGPGDEYTYRLYSLDVTARGEIYVAEVAFRNCPGPPPPLVTATPTPTATPRPSLSGPGAPPGSGDQADEPPCTKEGVLEFDSGHGFVAEHLEGRVQDIALRGEIVLLSRAGGAAGRPPQHVFALGAAEDPVFTYRQPRRLGDPVDHSAAGLRLDVAADGTVRAATGALAPFYRGAMTFGQLPDAAAPAPDPPPRQMALGLQDFPALAGPTFPLRVAAGQDIVVLEGPHQSYPPDPRVRTTVTYDNDVAALQHWSTAGDLLWQSAHFGNPPVGASQWNTGGDLVDLAADGADVYALSTDAVWYRPDPLPPVWYKAMAGARFGALDAAAGRIAILEVGGGRVLVLDGRGRLAAVWMLERPGQDHLIGDLAVAGDRVYLADQGRNQVVVRTIGGAAVKEWPTHDGPRAIATGPGGDVFVLGRGGFGLRYHPDGELVAAWRLPREYHGVVVEGRDIAVDQDGRVVVSFVGLSPPAADGDSEEEGRGYVIDAGGLWFFEAVPKVPDEGPEVTPGSCLATPAKTAAPKVLLLGDTVTVDLRVEGYCPGHHDPQQLAIVFDTSYSMANPYRPDGTGGTALSRGQALVDALLASLDATSTDVALVTFSDGAALDVPLPGDLSDVRGRIARLVADGDTRMGAGIDLARSELVGPRGDPAARRTILVVSDGVFKDDPAAAVAAAADAGLDLAAFIVTTPEFDAAARARLDAVLAAGSKVFVDPAPEAAADLIGAISAYVPNPGLFESSTVRDVLPANMAYVAGTSKPPAAYDPIRRTLTWDLGPVAAADGVGLTYQVVPRQAGEWPTNVEAHARYVDAVGHGGLLVFPVPRVHVLAPVPVPTPTPVPSATPTPWPVTARIYLPWGARGACLPRVPPRDIVLILDRSHTMSYPAGDGSGTKLDAAKGAAKAFVGLLRLPRDRVAVVAFDAQAFTALGLQGDRGAVEAAIDGLDNGWGTRIDRGLAAAYAVLAHQARPFGRPVAILLTDGLQNGSDDPVRQAARRVRTLGAEVYTIGLGPDVDADLLRAIATTPDDYLAAPQAADLARMYRRISAALDCPRSP